MHTELISQLKKLQHHRSEFSPFVTHLGFQEWSDKVLPLLSFDKKVQADFKSRVLAAECHSAINKNDNYISNINGAIGILNQAITLLETTDKTVIHIPLAAPEKITIRWIYEHAPWPFYAWFFGLLVGAFTLGFNFSSIIAAAQNKPLTTADPQTITAVPQSKTESTTTNDSQTKSTVTKDSPK